MIYAHISSASLYANIYPGIAEGLHFLQQAAPSIAPGQYQLSGGSYANVDSYTTCEVNPAGYEAHRKYIDIQYLVSGEEEVLVCNTNELNCSSGYDAERDVAFFRHADPTARVKLGGGYFVILFPHDAHEPQHCICTPTLVKKIVAKIAIVDY